jgi:hypothetical protein
MNHSPDNFDLGLLEVVACAVNRTDDLLEANRPGRGTEVYDDIDYLRDLTIDSLLWLDIHTPDANIDDHLARARNQYIDERLAK